MELQKIWHLLGIAGAVALGLPAILRAIETAMVVVIKIFEGVSGEEPEKSLGKFALALAKVRALSEKVADLIGKLFPKSPTAK